MISSASTAKALWFVWDGARNAVFGRNDGRMMEVSPRSRDCETLAVSVLHDDGKPELIDFFWVRRQRAFVRPLLLPATAKSIEVASFASGQFVPVVRYHLDQAQPSIGMQCDIVFARVQRDEVANGLPGLIGSQTAPIEEVEGRLASLQRNPQQSTIWAVATPYEDLYISALLERRINPLSRLFPREADLIEVRPVRYRKEKEENDGASQDDDEPAIQSVARELRYIISLEVDAPLAVSETDAVPGLVVFHYMRQRELIQLWHDTTPLVRFNVADFEKLESQPYPFAGTDKIFVVRPLRAHDDLIEGLRIGVRDQQTGNGPVRRFTIDFAFAALGDLLVVADMAALRLVGADGAASRYRTFRVGPRELEKLDLDPNQDERMVTAAAAVLESGNETPRYTDADDPTQILVDFLAAQTRMPSVDSYDLSRWPLLPLFAITYAVYARHAEAAGRRVDFSDYAGDPGVQSAAFLTPALTVNVTGGRSSSSRIAQSFSLRLAAELGASDLIMPSANADTDLRAADLVTNPRYRPLWEDAAAVGVKVDVDQGDPDTLVSQLKEFRFWYNSPDIVDELANSSDTALSEAFRSFLDERPPYQRPLAAPEFERLFKLVQPVATEVERSSAATGGGWNSGPAPARDLRSNEQLKSDLAKIVAEALGHDDPRVCSIAKRHGEANYRFRKQMREAEKELKDIVGSPAISGEILGLIDRLEGWASVDSVTGARSPDDRRQRIVDLSRAFRTRAQPLELSPASQLGREVDRITDRVEEICSGFRPRAAPADGEILTILPSYARLLGLHVGYRALVAARADGNDIPENATRLLSLWPERATDCWEKHEHWASTQGPAVTLQLSRPWTTCDLT
jgi:hypothetical protein